MYKKRLDPKTLDWVYTPGGKVLEMMDVVSASNSEEATISYLTEDSSTVTLHIGVETDTVKDGIIVPLKQDVVTAVLDKASGVVTESDHEEILEYLKSASSRLTGDAIVFLTNVAFYKNKYAFDVIKEKRVLFPESYPDKPTSNSVYGMSSTMRMKIRSLYVMITSELEFFEQMLKTRYAFYKADFGDMTAEEFLHKYKENPVPNSVTNKILEEDSLAGRFLRPYRKELINLCQLINEREGGNNTNMFIDWLKGFINLRQNPYDNGTGNLIKCFTALVETYNYNSHKLTDYLTRQCFYYGCFVLPVNEASNLRDYVCIAERMGATREMWPSYLTKAHNCIVRNSRGLGNVSLETANKFKQVCDEARKFYETKIGDYVVLLPHTHQDLFMEGVALNHCVGDYVSRVANRSTLVGFIRLKEKPEESLYTIEIDDNHRIIQAKGSYNSDVPDEIVDLIAKVEKRWENKLMKGATV